LMADDLQIVHVQRPPLPWRKEHHRTECGLPVAGHPVIGREEFKAKVKREGVRRAQVTTCQTCLDTANRHPSWEEDPVRAVGREMERWRWGGPRERNPFRDELLALAALVERHPEEFAEILEDIALVVPLGVNRKGRAV
jgi:hypothetical protein